MASYQQERGAFIEKLRAAGVPEAIALAVLRDANTLDRLAVAQCNGDWPADNGERRVVECKTCGSYWVPSDLKGKDKACGDCRAAKRITDRLNPFGIVPIFNGDPRGAVVKLQVPNGRTDDWGREGLCVPTREY